MKWFVVYVQDYEIFEVQEFDDKIQAEAFTTVILQKQQLGSGTRLLAVIHGTKKEYEVVETAKTVRIK